MRRAPSRWPSASASASRPRPSSLEETGGIEITGSFGVASYPTHAITKEELVAKADEAMYRIKSQTKNDISARPAPEAVPMSDGVLLTGDLSEIRLPTLLMSLYKDKETGVLTLEDERFKKALYIKEGRVVYATTTDPDERLGRVPPPPGDHHRSSSTRSPSNEVVPGASRGASSWTWAPSPLGTAWRASPSSSTT